MQPGGLVAQRRARARRQQEGQGAVRRVGAVRGGGLRRRDRGSSTMTCALVPLTPNDEMPARRGWPLTFHGTGSASSDTAPIDQSTCGVGRSTCRVRGSSSCRIAMTILMMPATPAAAWVCPRLDLIEPSHSGRSAGRSWP
ncbi:hypothetical protein GCM10027610_000350 [Dactylosporangium cerinum]